MMPRASRWRKIASEERKRRKKEDRAAVEWGKEGSVAGDAYIDFATVYDEWQALYPRPFAVALAPRILRAAKKYGTPARVLGDLACGTGTFAHWWARKQRGWRVYGTDLSSAMIASARRATSPVRKTPTPPSLIPQFFEQDLAATALPEKAGLLTCLFDSVNHITQVPAMKKILARVRDALLPGGLFIFDLLEEERFEETFNGFSIIEGPELYVGMQMGAETKAGVVYGDATFTFFRARAEAWGRLEFQLRERCWRESELRAIVRGAGIEVVDIELIDPSEDPDVYVPRTLWICRRKA